MIFIYFVSIVSGILAGITESFNKNITAFLIGIGILGEKKNITKKITGSLFCILGIILLNFF